MQHVWECDLIWSFHDSLIACVLHLPFFLQLAGAEIPSQRQTHTLRAFLRPPYDAAWFYELALLYDEHSLGDWRNNIIFLYRHSGHLLLPYCMISLYPNISQTTAFQKFDFFPSFSLKKKSLRPHLEVRSICCSKSLDDPHAFIARWMHKSISSSSFGLDEGRICGMDSYWRRQRKRRRTFGAQVLTEEKRNGGNRTHVRRLEKNRD